MTTNNPVKEISRLSNKLPEAVKKDVHQRLNDWFLSGGKDTDPYVYQQLDYVKRVVLLVSVSKKWNEGELVNSEDNIKDIIDAINNSEESIKIGRGKLVLDGLTIIEDSPSDEEGIENGD